MIVEIEDAWLSEWLATRPGDNIIEELVAEFGTGTGRTSPSDSEPRFDFGRCYEGAIRVARRCGLTYSEGFAQFGSAISLHAWAAADDGAVTETTEGDWGPQYFGVPLSNDFVYSLFSRHEMAFSVLTWLAEHPEELDHALHPSVRDSEAVAEMQQWIRRTLDVTADRNET